MRRRTFLESAAAVGAAVGLAGCGRLDDVRPPMEDAEETETADGPHAGVPHVDDYGTVVDLVAEGADPAGEESIVPHFEEHADDDTLLYLEDGSFLMEDTFEIEGVSNLAIVGVDATIVSPERFSDTFFSIRARSGLHVEGLAFDFVDGGRGGRALQLRGRDRLRLVDVDVRGTFQEGPGPVRLDVTDADGSGVVENLSMPDGSVADARVTGVYVSGDNQGDITFRECTIEGFSDNGLYADPPGGAMDVEGGYYANNGIASVRVKAGSTVRDATIRCDGDHRQFDNMRGIRATDYEARSGGDPVVVEDCRIQMDALTYSDGAIVHDSQLARLDVRNTHIEVNVDNVNGIWSKTPQAAFRDADVSLECDTLTVTGNAAGGAAIQVDERDGSTFENVHVHQLGANRDGIDRRRSSNNTVHDCVVNVRGRSVRLSDATADVTETISTHDQPTGGESTQ